MSWHKWRAIACLWKFFTEVANNAAELSCGIYRPIGFVGQEDVVCLRAIGRKNSWAPITPPPWRWMAKDISLFHRDGTFRPVRQNFGRGLLTSVLGAARNDSSASTLEGWVLLRCGTILFLSRISIESTLILYQDPVDFQPYTTEYYLLREVQAEVMGSS